MGTIAALALLWCFAVWRSAAEQTWRTLRIVRDQGRVTKITMKRLARREACYVTDLERRSIGRWSARSFRWV
jgi:hypothetical protein